VKAELSVETFSMLCILEHHFPLPFEKVQSTEMKSGRRKQRKKERKKGVRQDRGREAVRRGKVGDRYKLAG